MQIYVLFLILVLGTRASLGGQDGGDGGLDELLQGLDLASFTSGLGNGSDFKIDAQLGEKVRALIRHFKQDDPIGVPEGMGLDALIVEPLRVPNLEQTFSGMKMKFENISLYGLNKFRLNQVKVTLSELKVGLIVSIDQLFVNGLFQTSSWFYRANGNFSVTVSNVTTESEVSFGVDSDGTLQVEEVNMDVKFGDLNMQLGGDKMGFLGPVVQGMVNTMGPFLFDSIKPLILGDVERKIRGELNRQGRSVPQQFPNSIHPIDMFLSSARIYVREKGLDPFPVPDNHLASLRYGNFEISSVILHGLASLHRTGPVVVTFEENVVRVSVSMGASDVKGVVRWRWGIFRDLIGKRGTFQISVEYVSVVVNVGQPANLDKETTIDGIELEVGNIAVASDGIGTMDYVIEALVNIIPNLLRKQIVDALEEPIRKFVEDEVKKVVQLEDMIEERLPPKKGTN